MRIFAKTITLVFAALLATTVVAQDDNEELRIAAIEALISAPPERALPIASKVLAGNYSANVKEKALFVLSQINDPDAQATLLRFAADADGELQEEAIRMVGIGGDDEALAQLRGVYESGNRNTREAVLEALMIAGDKATVYEIATTAEGDDFEHAVQMLGVMNAHDELRQLRQAHGNSETLVQAYAISGDLTSLQEIARDGSDPHMQIEAIEAMGIVGGDEVNAQLVEIYRGADSEDVREAALQGMLIAGHDAGVLELYRAATDARQKKELLQMLVMMGSDEAWEAIDQTLAGNE